VTTLQVHGEPAPQGSKSVGRHGGVYEKSKKVRPWRDAIRAAALSQGPPELIATGPVAAKISFRLARPASHYRTGRNAHLLRDAAPEYPDARPDLDKLLRSTLDGLTQAGAYRDDGQVVRLGLALDYGEPGAGIEIWKWGGEPWSCWNCSPGL
jgi:Holliday junction resolvase RusA-like endonuclease